MTDITNQETYAMNGIDGCHADHPLAIVSPARSPLSEGSYLRTWWCALHLDGSLRGYVLVDAEDEVDAHWHDDALNLAYDEIEIGKWKFPAERSDKGLLIDENEISAMEQAILQEIKDGTLRVDVEAFAAQLNVLWAA